MNTTYMDRELPEELRQVAWTHFQEALPIIIRDVHRHALANGWWDSKNEMITAVEKNGWPERLEAKALIVVAMLGLAGHEIGEAMEAARCGFPLDDKLKHRGNLEVEIADTIIRLFDLLGWLSKNQDLAYSPFLKIGEIMQEKLEVNKLRGTRHGGKLV